MTTASVSPRVAGTNAPTPPSLSDVTRAPAFMAATGLLALAFLAVFFRWVVKQHELSQIALEDWGHVYVIPLISGYMVWKRRDDLMLARPSVYWPGLIPLVLGIVSYFYFIVGIPNHMFQGASMVLALFGVVLLLLGPDPMRVLFVPIAFLVFGITIAESVMLTITFQLKLIAAYGAWIALSLIGKAADFTVDLAGTTLAIDTGTGAPRALDVADACSGMRMVIAFVALAATVAIFSCRHWWQRVALVLLAVPVAVFMNVIRVVVLGLASLYNPKLASGDTHMLIGMLTLVPGLALFMGVVWALNRAVKDAPLTPAKPAPVRLSPPHWSVLKRPALLVSLALMTVAAGGMGAAISQAKIFLRKLAIYAPDARRLTDIPIRLPSWQRDGTDVTVTKEVEESLGTDNYVTRTYVPRAPAPGLTPLQFHAAYYTKQVDTVPHVPERCFVSGGMQIVREWGDVTIPLDRGPWIEDTDVPANLRGRVFKAPVLNEVGAVVNTIRLPFDPASIQMHVTEFEGPGGARIMSGYFFIANGGAVARANGVRLLAFNLTDSYSYYVKLQFSSTAAVTADELAANTGKLLAELLPEIMRCVPDWVEVVRGEYPADNPARAHTGGT